MRKRNRNLHAKRERQVDSRAPRVARDLRKFLKARRQAVYTRTLYGVASGIGSGAVSLLVLWAERRF
ncbi:hypothetical protein EES39_39630 [Streptomyces sp. ADI92-24]|uniref:hypothetical protein n=1 Tax=Streptomyces sp. ADI92-24 TaxID=1522756 RepID=UPI000F54DD27|nr:hypothetical protein [Streptomyces sp. ADI92-24]RPK31995.1 hypothetical protein EES39_39630 [Streptomyces sp. ADI92-24]